MSQSKAKRLENHSYNNNCTILQNVQNIVAAKAKKCVRENMCRRITRSQCKAKCLIELFTQNNLATNRKSKKHIPENMCKSITYSQSEAQSLKEETNNITISQNTQDILTTKSKKRITENTYKSITCLQSEAKSSKEETNNITISQNTQDILTTKVKKDVTKYSCRRITRSQSKAKCSEEFEDTTNSTIAQSVQDIEPTKSKRRLTRYACKYPGCSAIYDRPFRLERHRRVHTGERPYICDHPGCNRCYASFSHLRRHTVTHDRIYKGLECNQCSIIVSNYHNLARHYKRVHANPLRCKECFAQFRKKHHLALHMDQHMGITTYKCSQCSKSFDSMRKLKRHEKFHEGKGYRCPIPECSKVFDKWSLLRKHKVQHNDFKCNICEKEFKRNATLKLHLKSHTGHMPIPCPYDTCSRTYANEYSLKAHIRANHLDHKFICDICQMRYVAKHSLRKHIMVKHLGIGIAEKRTSEKSKRKQRKDAGIPKRSVVTILAGLQFIPHLDKELLKRENATGMVA